MALHREYGDGGLSLAESWADGSEGEVASEMAQLQAIRQLHRRGGPGHGVRPGAAVRLEEGRMNAKDKSISQQLEWTQAGLDAIKALPPETRNRLAEQENQLRAQKRSLEKHSARNEA